LDVTNEFLQIISIFSANITMFVLKETFLIRKI